MAPRARLGFVGGMAKRNDSARNQVACIPMIARCSVLRPGRPFAWRQLARAELIAKMLMGYCHHRPRGSLAYAAASI